MSNPDPRSKTILLSIKPKYAEKILQGEKRYELRLNVPILDVSTVYLYASRPVKAIVGMFDVSAIYRNQSPTEMWRTVKDCAGLDYAEYTKMFGFKRPVNAYKIVHPVRFPKPIYPHHEVYQGKQRCDPLQVVKFDWKWKPPQNFKYLSDSDVDCITAAVKVSTAEED